MVTKKVNKETNLFVLSGQDDGFDPYGWWGLPEHIQEKNDAPFTVIVNIKTEEELSKFSDLLNQPNLKNDTKRFTKSIWYPELIPGERGSNISYVWVDENSIGENNV